MEVNCAGYLSGIFVRCWLEDRGLIFGVVSLAVDEVRGAEYTGLVSLGENANEAILEKLIAKLTSPMFDYDRCVYITLHLTPLAWCQSSKNALKLFMFIFILGGVKPLLFYKIEKFGRKVSERSERNFDQIFLG